MDIRKRSYTFEDMRLVSMHARLEGAPPTVERVIYDLDGKGKLSEPVTQRGAVSDRARAVADDTPTQAEAAILEAMRIEPLGCARSLLAAEAERDSLRQQVEGAVSDAGDADLASMQAAFWRARAIELGASEDEWRRWSDQDQPADRADDEAGGEAAEEHET